MASCFIMMFKQAAPVKNKIFNFYLNIQTVNLVCLNRISSKHFLFFYVELPLWEVIFSDHHL